MPPQAGPMQGLNPGPMQAQQEQRKQAWTQQQIEYANEIAKQLNQSASENGPVYSPWAGAARMADALVGGLSARRAQEMQRQNLGASMPGAGDFTGGGASPTPSPDMTGGGAQGAPAPSAGAGDWSPGSGVVPMEAAKAAIAGNEMDPAKGYGSQGPIMPNGDQALGKYQVMKSYLPQHLAAAGMPNMTPEQFLASPEAQEKQFEGEFGGLMQKHGSFNKAAIEWFGGPKGLQHVLAGNDISDGFHSGSWYLNNANATLGKLAQAQGAPPMTQGGPQGTQNAPGATPAAVAPQTAPATPQGQQNGLPQFIPPTPGMPTQDFVNRLVMMGHPMGAQLQQEMTNMEQQQTPDGHTYIGNKYKGWQLSGLPAKPNISMVKTYGGAEIPMVPGQDAQGNTTLRPVAQGGAQGGTSGLYDYEYTKERASKEAERENKIYSGFSGDAEVHNQMKPFIQMGLSVLNNANLWTGPLNEQAQKVKQALVNAGMAPADAAAPMEVFKKTMAQAMVTKMNLMKTQGSETGEAASRIFLPMVQQMQDSSPSADNSVAGNRYLLNTMSHERDRANARADLADQWRTGHGGSMLGFDKELRDQERNNPIFQAQPDELFTGGHAPGAQPPSGGPLEVGASQPLAGGTLRRVK